MSKSDALERLRDAIAYTLHADVNGYMHDTMGARPERFSDAIDNLIKARIAEALAAAAQAKSDGE